MITRGGISILIPLQDMIELMKKRTEVGYVIHSPTHTGVKDMGDIFQRREISTRVLNVILEQIVFPFVIPRKKLLRYSRQDVESWSKEDTMANLSNTNMDQDKYQNVITKRAPC